ncbi:MAG: hypothetical protein ACFFCW_48515 [Candidatus Hodarchaeota archaeon]
MIMRALPGLICMSLVLTASGNTISLQTVQHDQDLQKAADFLVSQYNSTLQLLAEAPRVRPTVYWLWNDNFLGYYALKVYYPEIADTIMESMQRYGYMYNYAYEALFGQTVDLPFHSPMNYTILKGIDYEINLDIYNGSIMKDWQNYSNLLCLAALSQYWKGDITIAVSNFSKAVTMWTGTGITDEANDDSDDKEYKRYAVYKLALLLYTAKILDQPLSFQRDAENIIWQMQNKTNHGIHTDYNGDLDPSGSNVNVETTALVIGAYKWSYSIFNELNDKILVLSGMFLIYTIFLTIFSVYSRWLRKKF